jgi:hypothetical protein
VTKAEYRPGQAAPGHGSLAHRHQRPADAAWHGGCQQRGHVPQPVASLGGRRTSPLTLFAPVKSASARGSASPRADEQEVLVSAAQVLGYPARCASCWGPSSASSAVMRRRQSLRLVATAHHRLHRAWQCGAGQRAQLGFALHKGWGVTPPVLRKCHPERWGSGCWPRLAAPRCWLPRGQQRSRAGHPARRKALCASGRATDTTASRCAMTWVVSQLARRSTAMPRPLASARWRIVAGIPVPPLLVIHSYGKVT